MNRSERGFTLIEIMIVVAIIALLAAVAIPNVLRGRTTANESSAIGNLRALVSSLEMYRSVNNVYPDAWVTQMYTTPDPDFGPPSFGVDLEAGAGQTVSGFTFFYVDGAAPVNTYTLRAIPQTLGTTGTRSFLADQTGLIRHCTGTGTVLQLTGESTIDAAPTVCG